MAFIYKTEKEFVALDVAKKRYYLARLYIRQDTTPCKNYQKRLFTCISYLKKQPEQVLSVLYNYLTEHTHDGLRIWTIVPKAILFDQQRRRSAPMAKQKEYTEDMLDDILKEK